MKARSLKDLKPLQQQLEQERARAAHDAAAQAAAERLRRAEQTLFERTVGTVRPLRAPARASSPSMRPAPVARQRQRDDKRVLQESLSDEFDATTLLHVDGELSFHRPELNADVTARLRRGQWAVQAQIDLHGLRTDAAREALVAFLREAQRAGARCVRVVHGKGLGSPGGAPVLKSKVQGWLIQKKEVLAFVQARPLEGGAGALLVLLAPHTGGSRPQR